MSADRYYRLYCEMCGYTRYTDGSDIQDLRLQPRSKIQQALPKWDEEKKCTITKPFYELPKQFRCPKCGRLITPRRAKRTENADEKTNTTGNQAGDAGFAFPAGPA